MQVSPQRVDQKSNHPTAVIPDTRRFIPDFLHAFSLEKLRAISQLSLEGDGYIKEAMCGGLTSNTEQALGGPLAGCFVFPFTGCRTT